MATAVSDDVELGPDEVLVEKKIVPARRSGLSPFGLIVLLAFIATCGYVFFGGNLGSPQQPPASATTPSTTPAQ